VWLQQLLTDSNFAWQHVVLFQHADAGHLYIKGSLGDAEGFLIFLRLIDIQWDQHYVRDWPNPSFGEQGSERL
jgi:hypothetical protein